MSDLTVENIEKSYSLGLAVSSGSVCIDSEWVKVYKVVDFLLSQLDTIERETAEKCAMIAEDEYCGMDSCCAVDTHKAISDHFKLGGAP